MKAFYFIALILFLSGCNVYERSAKKVQWVERKAPGFLPEYCGEKFPPRVDSFYKPGRVITIPVPAITVDCDSVVSATDSTSDTTSNIVFVTCPPSHIRVDTLIVERENTARIKAMVIQIDDLDKINATLQEQKKLWRNSTLVLGAILIFAAVVGFVLIKLKVL